MFISTEPWLCKICNKRSSKGDIDGDSGGDSNIYSNSNRIRYHPEKITDSSLLPFPFSIPQLLPESSNNTPSSVDCKTARLP